MTGKERNTQKFVGLKLFFPCLVALLSRRFYVWPIILWKLHVHVAIILFQRPLLLNRQKRSLTLLFDWIFTPSAQHWQAPALGAGVWSVNRVPLDELTMLGSVSRLSDILSQMISTKRSKTACKQSGIRVKTNRMNVWTKRREKQNINQMARIDRAPKTATHVRRQFQSSFYGQEADVWSFSH